MKLRGIAVAVNAKPILWASQWLINTLSSVPHVGNVGAISSYLACARHANKHLTTIKRMHAVSSRRNQSEKEDTLHNPCFKSIKYTNFNSVANIVANTFKSRTISVSSFRSIRHSQRRSLSTSISNKMPLYNASFSRF